MKKNVILTLIIAMALSMTACESSDGEDNSTTIQETTVISEAPSEETIISESSTEISEETTTAEIDYDVRKVKWGMSAQEVIASEDTEYDYYSVEDGGIMYLDVIAGKVKFTSLLYNLGTEDSLYCVSYFAQNTHTNNNLYIEDYNNLKEKLISLYGETEREAEEWNNDLFKDSPDDYGLAVAKGDLQMLSVWSTDTTRINLMLTGDNYQCMLLLQYVDINAQVDDASTDGL